MARKLKKYYHEAMLDCVRLHTNAPDSFITWAAFSVIGGIMKRKFYIQEGTYTIYPNQYIVLVAPPAVGKGTAINFNWRVVRESQTKIANMISDRVTGPRIIQRIAEGWNSAPIVTAGLQITQGSKDHSCTIFSTELSILLGASDQMIDFLCECWDRNDYEYDTKNAGSAFIKDMATSLIGGTVPDFIRHIDRNRNMTIKGGFTSRCLFIYEDRPARFILHPPPIKSNPISQKLLEDLQNDAEHIASLPGGEFTYSAQALVMFDNFMTAAMIDTSNDTEAVTHFKGRMGVHISKLAMVMAVSRADTLVISQDDMSRAIYFVKSALQTIEKVFRGTGDSSMAEATGHVQSYLDKTGGATKKELLRALYRHMDSDALERILYVLVEIGFCKKTIQGTQALFVPITTTTAAPKAPPKVVVTAKKP